LCKRPSWLLIGSECDSYSLSVRKIDRSGSGASLFPKAKGGPPRRPRRPPRPLARPVFKNCLAHPWPSCSSLHASPNIQATFS